MRAAQALRGWHTIYTRMNRWIKAGVLDRLFEELQWAQLVRVKIEAVSLDSTSIKVHMVAADARTAVTFCLSPGQAHYPPYGRVHQHSRPDRSRRKSQ